MACQTAAVDTGTPLVTAPQLEQGRTGSHGARVLLFASIVVSFLAASSAPSPLYQHYDQIWHGTALSTTVAFGSYAVAVLAGLLVLGELAEHIGRRPVLLAAIAGQVVALGLFATAGSFDTLLLGRVVQGVSAGAALGALGAAMIDADRVRGTIASAAAPGAGTGLGAIAAGLIIAYLPWPDHLIYLLLIVVLAAQAVGVVRLTTATVRRPGTLGSLRPGIAVPRSARAAFVAAAPVLFAVWALAGFYGSLGPALSRQLADSHSVALGGVGLFVIAGVSSVTTVVLRDWSGRSLMTTGIAALVLGVAGTVVAVEAGTVWGYFAATAVAGVGFGSGFQGGIRTVVPLAGPQERAGLLSAVFLVSYAGMGVPAVIAGWVVSHGHELTQVAVGYAAVIIALALIAQLALLRTSTRQRVAERSVVVRG